MSGAPFSLASGLRQTAEPDRYTGKQFPAEVTDRFESVDFVRLINIAQEALEEFAWAVDNEPSGVTVVGLSVVGSFLTTEFDPSQSDLDVYLLTDVEYQYGEDFCRMLLDPQSAFRDRMYSAVPHEISYVDPLDLLVEGAHWNVIRSPSITLVDDSADG